MTINLPHNKKQVGACPARGIYVIVFLPVGVVKGYRNCQQEQREGWYFTIATWVMQERLSLNWGLPFQRTINFQAVVKALLTFLSRDFPSQWGFKELYSIEAVVLLPFFGPGPPRKTHFFDVQASFCAFCQCWLLNLRLRAHLRLLIAAFSSASDSLSWCGWGHQKWSNQIISSSLWLLGQGSACMTLFLDSFFLTLEST